MIRYSPLLLCLACADTYSMGESDSAYHSDPEHFDEVWRPYLSPHASWQHLNLRNQHLHAIHQLLSKLEGIIPALETSHAIAHLDKLCKEVPGGTRIVLNCSGRGDKDVNNAIKYINLEEKP